MYPQKTTYYIAIYLDFHLKREEADITRQANVFLQKLEEMKTVFKLTPVSPGSVSGSSAISGGVGDDANEEGLSAVCEYVQSLYVNAMPKSFDYD